MSGQQSEVVVHIFDGDISSSAAPTQKLNKTSTFSNLVDCVDVERITDVLKLLMVKLLEQCSSESIVCSV